MRKRSNYMEPLTEGHIKVVHPKCGGFIFLLQLMTHRAGLSARGICPACGRYVALKLKRPQGEQDNYRCWSGKPVRRAAS